MIAEQTQLSFLDRLAHLNRTFYAEYQNQEASKKILVESPPDYLLAVHGISIASVLLHKAKGYVPSWISSNTNVPLSFLQSYVHTTSYIDANKFDKKRAFKLLFNILYTCLKLLFTKDYLNIRYDGIHYGDVIYDSYLATHQVGTIPSYNLKYIKILVLCFLAHEKVRYCIVSNDFDAILTSHSVSLAGSVLTRVALQLGKKAFLAYTIHELETISEMKSYCPTPKKKELNELFTLDDGALAKLFLEVRNQHNNDAVHSVAAQFGYSEKKQIITDRTSFAHKFGLDSEKKNIFIMLHAFTDYPHSHFTKMLFDDYADWFIETLNFAKKHAHVNWIFKQHPASRLYPTKDIDYEKLFLDKSSNIAFISDETSFNTASIEFLADAVVTCLGSAGIEMPAYAGIPAICAAENHYSASSFAQYPTTREEYFTILCKLDSIEKLSYNQRREAQVYYIFINEIAMKKSLSMHFFPKSCSVFEANTNFEQIAENIYKDWIAREDFFVKEIAEFVTLVARDDFKMIRNNAKGYLSKDECN